ncbi:hypothetical protein BPOR_0273g00040 [Botrytis porri]|uniref:Aminotransferase class I/classII large domain-containing protein n=1 Tax=Botrytis porri TaxID=87229 RepID=A0A4Z1KT34_9HELO|nr:hypothetical protein BPOR_0273g00040 [Botrytis porri]
MANIIPPTSNRMNNIIQALFPPAAVAAADHAKPDLRLLISIPITSDNLVTASGVGFCLDAIASCMCEPGDSILVPGPYSVGAYLCYHASITMFPAYPSPPSTTLISETHFPALETAYNSSPDPKRIKGLLIFNPHAPFGHAKKGLHYISDEVYGCLEFGCDEKAERFVSALSLLDYSIGPERKAMIGRSKGCLITQSNPMLRIGAIISTYNQTSSLPALLLTHLLNSDMLPFLLNKNNAFLSKNCTLLTSTLNHFGIEFLPAIAGFVVFTKLAKDTETWNEEAIVKILQEHKVIVSPRKQFGGAKDEKGWARITIAVPEEDFKEGVKRIRAYFVENLS